MAQLQIILVNKVRLKNIRHAFQNLYKNTSVRKIIFLVAKQNSLNISKGNFAPMGQVLFYFKISKAFAVTLIKSFKKTKCNTYININTLNPAKHLLF